MPEGRRGGMVRARSGLFVTGGLLTVLGAILVFALKDPNEAIGSVELQPLGGILMVAGILLIAVAGISLMGGGNGNGGNNGVNLDNIRTVGGLVAVVAALIAVTALTIYTLAALDSSKENTVVGVTSSAFGIISAVTGAYLGIKITADTQREATNVLEKVADKEAELGRPNKGAKRKEEEQTDPSLGTGN